MSLSVLNSLKISTLETFTRQDSSNVEFSELKGDLTKGELVLGVNQPNYQPLGRLSWQQSYWNWLLLNPVIEGEYQGANSELRFSGSSELLSRNLRFKIDKGHLQIEDLMPLLALNRDFGRWLGDLSGRFEEIRLQAQWPGSEHWLQKTQGAMRLNEFSFLGETLPPVIISIEQKQEQVQIAFRAEQAWQMRGEIILTPLKHENVVHSVQYQGTIKVKASTQEALPNWASLMRSTSMTSAQTNLQGQWSIN